jgi:hypothetical protein
MCSQHQEGHTTQRWGYGQGFADGGILPGSGAAALDDAWKQVDRRLPQKMLLRLEKPSPSTSRQPGEGSVTAGRLTEDALLHFPMNKLSKRPLARQLSASESERHAVGTTFNNLPRNPSFDRGGNQAGAASERLEDIEQEMAKGEERIKRQAVLVGLWNAPDEIRTLRDYPSYRGRGKI